MSTRALLRRSRPLAALLLVAATSPAWAEAPPNIQADQDQAGWLTAKGRTPEDLRSTVSEARSRACAGTRDPILGCGDDVAPAQRSQPFIVRFEKAGVGLNASVIGHFPWWGNGLNIGAAGGLSFRFFSWFYEGYHRITWFQLDLDAGYRFVGEPRAIWYAGLGPVFNGLDLLGPTVKAQVFVSRPISWDGFEKGGRFDTIGITVSVGLDLPLFMPKYLRIDPETAVRTPTDERPALDGRGRVYLFQDEADYTEAKALRDLERRDAQSQRKTSESKARSK